MNCPYCLSNETKVVDSRESASEIRRRRECLKCKKRFTTYERVETVNLYIIKKDGRREPYSREKLSSGFMKACHKRPIPHPKIERAVNDVERRLLSMNTTEIKSSKVGELVMAKLKKLDKVAYIRFASVYKEFTDLETFQKELRSLIKGK